jgi:hypothetical protein
VEQQSSDDRQWRVGVDLGDVEVALGYVGSLLEAVYRTGSSMMVRVDAERTMGANPSKFTVVISDAESTYPVIRSDGPDLVRTVLSAVRKFDQYQE